MVVAAAQPEPRPLNFSSAADVAGAVMSSAKAAADEVDRLMDVDSLPHLFLSYGNAAYFQFVHNWALSVQQIGAPYVIGCASRLPQLGRLASCGFADGFAFE